MAYLALYREWRPKLFREIVGQEHITKTLLNALKQEKIAHAYLFSGPRGTGKTTAAKILAKSLNCQQRDDEEPCNHCASCLSIDQGSAMEVFEIDAASNRGINEIRDLRENIKLSSIQGKYKVYIIDEVHMLTTEAFNALLKTLEEPPSQVVFILATTEVQKIPLTILSRVQRFEFHRIPAEGIQKRLTEVCDSLKRKVDPSALMVIAQKSEGGLRDALSILDQCLLQEDPIGVEEVYLVLGMVGETYSSQLVDELASADYAKCLNFLSEGIQQGRDPRQIIRELLDYLRQILLTAATGEAPMVAPHIQNRLIEQSTKIGISRILHWISILLQGEGQLKYASNARLAAELLLVQTIHESQLDTIKGQEEILKRLSAIEEQVHSLPVADNKSFREVKQPSSLKMSKVDTSKVVVKKVETGKNISLENTVSDGMSKLSIEIIQTRWNEVMDQVKKRKKSTQAFLMEGRPAQLNGNNLVILFREGCSFHKDKVNQVENRQTIEEVLKQLFGVNLILQNFMENEFEMLAPPESKDLKNQEEVLINKAMDMFGSDLVVVRE